MFLLDLDIRTFNRALLFLFAFTLAFERAFPFLPSLSYPKLFAILYVGSLFCNPNFLRTFNKLIVPKSVILLFALFLFLNFLNPSLFEYGITKIDQSLLLNILLFWFLLIHERIDKGILSKSLFFFFFGYLFLVLAYFLGFYDVGVGGRVSIGAALPNSLAFFGVFAIASSIISSKQDYFRSSFIRALFFLSSLSIIPLILATGSRSGAIALFLVYGIYIILSGTRRLLSLFLLGGLIFLIFIFSDVLVDRLINTAETGDLGGRLMIILFCLDLILQNPIFGVGESQYEYLAVKTFGYSPSPHNVFLETYLFGGLMGLILWLTLCYKGVKVAFQEYFAHSTVNSFLLLPPILLMGVSGQVFNNTIVFLVFAVIMSYQKDLKNA